MGLFGSGGLVGNVMGAVFGKPQTAPVPDYMGMAQEQSKGNLELEKFRTQANRFNEYNPYGSRTWTQNGDQWTSRTNLSPEQQALFDQEQKNAGMAGLFAGQALGGYNPNIDWGNIRQSPVNVGQTAQDAIMSRLRPEFERNEEAMRTRLANQGIMPGSEAYNYDYGNFNQARNDAYTQAALQGIGLDQEAQARDLQLEQFRLNQPLGLFQALQGQGQASVPQFAPGAAMGQVAGPDLMGAANSTYQAQMGNANAKNAQNNAIMGGLFSLGAGALAGRG